MVTHVYMWVSLLNFNSMLGVYKDIRTYSCAGIYNTVGKKTVHSHASISVIFLSCVLSVTEILSYLYTYLLLMQY